MAQRNHRSLVAAALFFLSCASRLCAEGTNAPIPNPPPENLVTDAIHRMHILGGIVSLNPFQIGGPPFTITNNNTEVFGTVQVNYQDRWAWEAHTKQGGGDNNVHWAIHSLSDLGRNLDIQIRAGYVFGQNQTNASTILGSGNFVGEFALGERLFQTCPDNKSSAFIHSFNFPEMNLSLVTDRGFSDTHTTLTIGPAYVASFLPPGSTNINDRAHFLIRAGGALYDLPKLTVGTGIADNGHGAPAFHSVVGWAVETEMSYPLGEGKFITAGARAYPARYPAPWSVWIGMTYSIDSIKSAVQKILP